MPWPRLPSSVRLGRWFVPSLLTVLLASLMAWAPITSLVHVLRMPMHHMGLPMYPYSDMPWASQKAQAPIIQPLAQFPDLERNGLFLQLGLHAESIYELSLAQRTFFADGRFWLVWSNGLQEWMQREKIAPQSLVEFVNQVQDWNSTLVVDTPLPELRSDGNWYQSFRFSSYFSIPNIDLRKYPFGAIHLPIVFQVNPTHSFVERRPLFLVPEMHQRGIIGEEVSLDGYLLNSASLRPVVRTYRADFGEKRLVRLSQVQCIFDYRSAFWPGFIQYILPMAIIVLVVMISPYLSSSLGDVRLAIPTTALLTLVFLQQGYTGDLPKIPYLSYLDKLYAVAYFICIGIFILFAWSTNYYEQSPMEHKAAVQQRLDRIDQRFQFVALGLMLVVALEAWLT